MWEGLRVIIKLPKGGIPQCGPIYSKYKHRPLEEDWFGCGLGFWIERGTKGDVDKLDVPKIATGALTFGLNAILRKCLI